MKRKYRVMGLDVWGNKDDGWEVNNAFKTSTVIELDDECTTTDIKRALYEANYVTQKFFPMKVDFTGDYEHPYRLYVTLESQRFNSKPFVELWEETENE